MTLSEMTAVFDACYSLFLREIGEPEQNVLRIVLLQGKLSDKIESIKFGSTTIEDVQRVRVTEDSRVLEMTWNNYIAYVVTNESFSWKDEVPHSGRLLRHYSESPFLDYVRSSTIATDEYPGPAIHLRVVSETHVVDVVSTTMPTLRVLQPDRLNDEM